MLGPKTIKLIFAFLLFLVVPTTWCQPNNGGRPRTLEEQANRDYARMQEGELRFRMAAIQRRLEELEALEGGWLTVHELDNSPLDRGIDRT